MLAATPSVAEEPARTSVGLIQPQAGRPYVELRANHADASSDTSLGLVWRGTRVRVLETRDGWSRVAVVGWVDAGALVLEDTGQRVAELFATSPASVAERGSASGPILRLSKKLAGKKLKPNIKVLAFELGRLATDRYFYEMRGAVRNTSERTMAGIIVELLLYDREKQLLQRETIAGEPSEVPPGLVAEFQTLFEPPAGLVRYQVNFAWTWRP